MKSARISVVPLALAGAEGAAPDLSLPEAEDGAVSGLYDIGDRELFIECIGEGSPTVILEPGQGDPRTQFAAIQSTVAERTRVCTYDRGDNPESFDWTTSSEQLEATPAPADVPMVLLHSTATQCEGEVRPCSKTADLYAELGEEYAAEWPGAEFEADDLTHAIHLADEQRVVEIITQLVDESGEPSANPLVGEWQQVTTCAELRDVFTDAGIEDIFPDALAGNGLVACSPAEIAARPDPCEGAVPRLHSHFFTADGQFVSHNWNGGIVDDGTYTVDGSTVHLSTDAGNVALDLEVDGDELRLTPVEDPGCADDACRGLLAYASMVAIPGSTWHRVTQGDDPIESERGGTPFHGG